MEWTELLQRLLGSTGVYVVVTVALALWALAKSKAAGITNTLIQLLCKQAVAWVEKEMTGAPGAAKLRAAITWVSARLNEKGIRWSEAQITDFIEDAVATMNLVKATIEAEQAKAGGAQ